MNRKPLAKLLIARILYDVSNERLAKVSEPLSLSPPTRSCSRHSISYLLSRQLPKHLSEDLPTLIQIANPQSLIVQMCAIARLPTGQLRSWGTKFLFQKPNTRDRPSFPNIQRFPSSRRSFHQPAKKGQESWTKFQVVLQPVMYGRYRS